MSWGFGEFCWLKKLCTGSWVGVGKNSDTSHDGILRPMGHGAVNELIGGTIPFPWHYMHPRGCVLGI
jgi:hypothetical protein